ncbi:ACP S-malonyltransferase [Streptomyces alboniger]|uniref:Malonyl CoA-acyl carrier protein transacylase n=1 Tax=Streptomyces alboniger TaxID=132473 RepID=A0A5J6HXP8_STRAD|nr:ACP S-malonyltransferase [Streptomyces alboniger]QEV21767.1 ACP S-malonyltransferase [Streptomyces alboniger]
MNRPTAFVFPGQGSQFPGMGRELARFGPAARDLVDRAEDVTGLPVGALMTEADADTLADPEYAQVLVFVWSLAALHRLRDRGLAPSAVAGHSLGEYTALTACGSLDPDTALSLVSCRGRAMSTAARQTAGTMAAIVGLAPETVRRLCQEACDDTGFAVVANLNSPRQTVVSGTVAAVQRVVDAARDAGALRARRLPVGGAYHSPLMAGAPLGLMGKLAEARLAPPRIPLVSSATGQLVSDIEEYREVLFAQILRPVRWQDTVHTLLGLGVRTFVEAGPGRVLSGLGREMAREARHLSVHEALGATPPPTAVPASPAGPPTAQDHVTSKARKST